MNAMDEVADIEGIKGRFGTGEPSAELGDHRGLKAFGVSGKVW